MKKLVIASATVVATALLIAGCGQSTPNAPPPAGPKLTTSTVLAVQSEDERLLDEAWRGLALFIEISETQGSGQPLGETYSQLEEIEKAQSSLRGLDQTRSMAAAIMEHEGADVQEIDTVMNTIAEARLAVLARAGFAR